MSKYAIQYASRWSYDLADYIVIGAIVLSPNNELTFWAFTPEGETWAARSVPVPETWSDSPRDFLSYLFDRNATTTAYSEVETLSAESAEDAAGRAQNRLL